MNKTAKNIVICVLLLISFFLLNLMDNNKITYLTVENRVAKEANKLTNTNKKVNKKKEKIVKEEIETTTFSVDTQINKKIKNITNIRIDDKKIIFNSSKSNVVSNIDKKDLDYLLNSKKNNWYIINENGNIFNTLIEKNIIKLYGDEFKSISIFDGNKNYTIDYKNGLWEINYPNIKVGIGLNVRYFNSLEKAIETYKENEIITLLQNLNVENSIDINKSIVIDGNNKKINCQSSLFNILNNIDIKINNINIETNNLVNVKKKNKSSLSINDSYLVIKEKLSNNKIKTNIKDSNVLRYL